MEIYEHRNERVIYVDETPVFLWIFDREIDLKPTFEGYTATATMGKFRCL